RGAEPGGRHRAARGGALRPRAPRGQRPRGDRLRRPLPQPVPPCPARRSGAGLAPGELMPTSRAERWVLAPVALLLLDAEARVLDANDELLRILDVPDVEALAGRRLGDLLTVGGRIYWETHLAPTLHI